MEMDAKELQFRLLEIMKKLHTICVENDLNYYIIGGTCLGAKRHQGFIPWDDDIDVGMPREDYDKFCNLTMDKFPENLELRYYKNTKKSPFHFVKLIDNSTTLIEQEYRDYVEGLYIDVFPFDGANNYSTSIREKIRCNMIWFLKVLILYHCMTETRNSIQKKILIAWSKQRKLEKLHEIVEKKITKYSYKESTYVANFFGAYKEKEIFPKEFLGKPQLYKFEDGEFFGPEKIDDYLTYLYGDYMRFPPKDQCVFKHNYYYLDFEKGYREYIRNH